MKVILVGIISLQVLLSLGCAAEEEKRDPTASMQPATEPNPEPTRASQSQYNHDIRMATTSENLTKADLAWHAVNTYGWDCEEVLEEEEETEDFFLITCANGTRLRVYPRQSQHPRITNADGGYN